MTQVLYVFKPSRRQAAKLEKLEGQTFWIQLSATEGGAFKAYHPTKKWLWGLLDRCFSNTSKEIFWGSLSVYFQKGNYPGCIKPDGQWGEATVSVANSAATFSVSFGEE